MTNIAVLQGRLCADPELRQTQSGIPVAGFTLAVDRDFADKETGERQCDFFPVVAWRQHGEFASKHFSKGQQCIVTGRLQSRGYTDKDGIKRRVVELVAEHINFAGPKGQQTAGQTAPPPEPQEFYDADGELPF